MLQQYGFGATVFLPTAYIGEQSIQFKGADCLTWREVRELNDHGIVFGSHTVTHPQLRELSRAALAEELAKSKQTIEEKLGCGVESFAYPYAFPQTDSDFKNSCAICSFERATRTECARSWAERTERANDCSWSGCR